MWRFDLEGDPADLRLLRRALEGARWSIQADSQGWFITSSDWDELGHNQALLKAQEVAESLSGAASLILDWPTRFSLGNAIRVDARGLRHFCMNAEPGEYDVRINPAGTETEDSDGRVHASRAGDPVASWLRILAGHEPVRRVLQIYSRPEPGWRDLYNVFEIIRGDAGEAFSQWISNTKHERFRRTANSFEAVGQGARHGTLIPAPGKVMTIAEARSLARKTVLAWLEWRADIFDDFILPPREPR